MLKFIVLVLLFLAILSEAAPSDDFVITINTNNTNNGSSSNTQFAIPAIGIGYDYNVDCNDDGTLEIAGANGNYTCDYTSLGGPGVHTLRISDNTGVGTGFPRIYFHNIGDALKILSIEQWGTGQWASMGSAFYGTENIVINATDTPNLSAVVNLNNMFKNAYLVNPKVGTWDISNVLTMGGMFTGVTLPTDDYDLMLQGFAAQSVQDNVLFGGGNSVYCQTEAETARANLINNNNWTINDAGKCNPNNPSDHFVIAVKTDNLGSSSDTQFTIPTSPFGEVYNYNIDCNNDGIDEATVVTGSYTCDYTALGGAGTYTIRIKPRSLDGFPRIYFNNTGDKLKIVALEQWGTAIWGSSMNKAFMGTSNMQINATDIPNFANVTNMNLMFFNAASANPETKFWDTSSVTSMISMFQGASSATPDTALWITTNVTNMSFMFENAIVANPDTSLWNTANVTRMAGMFEGAVSANPDTSMWNTSQVTGMHSMFKAAVSANPDTSMWNTSQVTSMHSMFSGAVLANPDTSSWDITQVTDMVNMFLDVTLPSADYDAMLVGFEAQNVQNNVAFHAGNSTACSSTALAAKSNLITIKSWQITDGGMCDDTVFNNGFETAPVVLFKTADARFAFDFSNMVSLPEDETPRLIATGLNEDNQVNVKIYVRQFDGGLQIMQSQLFEDIDGEQLWSDGLWYEVFETGLFEVTLR